MCVILFDLPHNPHNPFLCDINDMDIYLVHAVIDFDSNLKYAVRIFLLL